MNIEINISFKTLEKHSLTPNEYVYLYHLYHKLKLPNYQVNLDKLDDLKLIKYTRTQVYARPYMLMKLLEQKDTTAVKVVRKSSEEAWEALLKLYPKKYESRPLHDKSRAKPKFLRKINSHSIDDMLKGLEIELEIRQKHALAGAWYQAPKALSAWLNQETWVQYIELSEDELEEKTIENNIKRI